MGVYDYKSLIEHIGHSIECVAYGEHDDGPDNVAVECVNCGCVLLDYDKPQILAWYPLERVGNFFAEHTELDGSKRIWACPMNSDGSRGDDTETCDCDDQDKARQLYSEARIGKGE